MTTPHTSPLPPDTTLAQRDAFARFLGITVLDIRRGYARCQMPLLPHHLNGLSIVHGGAIFSLADYAFAVACNAHGTPTVAVNANISYLKAARGAALIAEAQESAFAGKMGTYDVRITDDSGDTVATFQGLAYRKEGPRP